MNALDIVLWGVVPYLVALTLIAGLVWRYRYDQFGWTTRSSQLYESKLLRIASPLFHFGLLMVLGGHLLGLLVPKAWTDLVISQETYHLIALSAGTLAGVATLVGIALLIYRRRTTGPVFLATTRNDKLMYVILAAAIVFGLIATLTGDHTPTGEHHNYRETVSIWFRSLLVFQPDIQAMAAATWQFKVHILIGLTLFALVPFSRLVHAFTVPLHYLFRPYVVYRSRDAVPPAASHTRVRGWDPVGTRDRDRGDR
ncbi:MAG: respiratory nitrate reductase subunit gamma [Propionicimonas sp.]|uniref:respiratory nitrate reductase subunit gamma n=1 Tax=Propionicimonas sp. TaxID=1955623 RepID=UPI002B1F3F6E|nr:respiratory nitrate reductase subunit gamma [Propionicimonas sp.]MEA4944986.1 respiratory nitrate reductase subunit gamma [Propionicimonas sp.]MEA5053919.1 respiratory nitrate reductase subunit gamma [Propionicimonas sp.]MEA5116214.1 respiratory nitrate reductase subunit gamma [Propionicimonas sp.]